MANTDKPWYWKWWGILIVGILCVFTSLFLAFSFYVFHSVRTLNNLPMVYSAKDLSPAERVMIEGLDNPSLGTDDPQLTIVQFADFACPYCRLSFPDIRQISYQHQDRIRLIFRAYPMAAEHSLLLAQAAYCADDQGLFWPMHDRLYIEQDIRNISQLIVLARQINADEEKFTTCLRQEKFLPKITKDISDALALGIAGTPTWFINGHQLSGRIPRAEFFSAIEILLNSQ